MLEQLSTSRLTARLVAVGLVVLGGAALMAQAPPPPSPPTSSAPPAVAPPGGAYQIVIGGAPPRIAIPDCVASDGASREACGVISKVLRDDLTFEGLFEFVSDQLVKSLPTPNFDSPNFVDWQGIEASVLVLTRANQAGSDLNLDVKVFDVQRGAVMLAKQFSGKKDNPRSFAHRASDDIMTLTQYKGVAQSRIAFSSDRDGGTGAKEIYIADYDGFNPRRLTATRSLNLFPSWSADGRTIAYVSYRNYVASILRAFIYEGRGDNVTKSMTGNFAAPSYSRDGRRLAYAGIRGGNAEIYVAGADGSNAQRITQSAGVDTAPTWSPTGAEVAFTSDRGGGQRIWVMGADGLNIRRLTSMDSDAPAWNPSREWSEIAFTARLEGSFEIAVVDLVSGQIRQISEGLGSCEYPSWSANGRHLLFSCRKGGKWQLTMTDRIGRNPRALEMPGNNVYPDWGP